MNDPPKAQVIKGGLKVDGELSTGGLIIGDGKSDGKKVTLDGLTANKLEIGDAKIKSVTSEVSEIGKLNAGESGKIELRGFLQVNGNIIFGEQDAPVTAFIETLSMVRNGDSSDSMSAEDMFHGQSALFAHDFETEAASGWQWTHADGHQTPAAALARNCTSGVVSLSKTYFDLPEHSTLDLSANFHFSGSWRGQVGVARINDDPVWLEAHTFREGSNNMFALQDRQSVPVKVTIPHTERSVTVKFESSLEPNYCAGSWAVDDISLSVN